MDECNHDGFHPALASWESEFDPRQSAYGRVDATGARVAQTVHPLLILTDGWGTYKGSIRRAFRKKVKKVAGIG